jgi:hypothetical protein
MHIAQGILWLGVFVFLLFGTKTINPLTYDVQPELTFEDKHLVKFDFCTFQYIQYQYS